MKPYEFMDKMYDQRQMTASWAFWDLEAPTQADEDASRIPSRSASEGPEDEHGDVCIHCEIKALQESNENLAAEVYELKTTVEHLIRMLGGK